MHRRNLLKVAATWLLLLPSIAGAVGLVTQSGPRLFSSSSSSSSGGGSSYTATHYVTTTASGSGDGSIGNPWTFAQAVSTASGSNKVQVAPGVYSVTPIDASHSPSLEVTHDGTNGTEAGRLTFFCQYPGAYNRATPANQCEIRSNNTAIRSALLGVGESIDHVVFDGFTFDENYCPPRPSTGCVGIGGGQSGPVSTDIHIRRFYFKNTEQPSGDNYSSIICVFVTNLTITDSWFEGGNTGGEGDALSAYGCLDMLVEHNMLDGTQMGLYAKGSVNGATRFNTGIFRFNWAEDIPDKVYFSTEVDPSGFLDITQNVCLRSRHCWRSDPAGGIPGHRMRVSNNTNVDPVGAAGCAYEEGADTPSANADYNNIIARLSSDTSVAMCLMQFVTPPTAFTRFDYNTYYNGGSTPTFQTNEDDICPGDCIALAAFVTLLGDGENSAVRNPLFVSSSDFHLQGGSSEVNSGFGGVNRGAYITGSEEIGIRASPSY